jgi:hypothetical protein
MHKFIVYILCLSTSLLFGLLGYYLQEGCALILTTKSSIVSWYGLLMVYFHWPTTGNEKNIVFIHNK